MVRRWFYLISIVVLVIIGSGSLWWPGLLWSLIFIVPAILIGLRDSLQRQHTLLRNFPLIGHLRYFFEVLRPEIQQYFIESNIDAYPIEREFRSLIYQRSKGALETLPFGTQRDVYRIGYEWVTHSISPIEFKGEEHRVKFGGPDCVKPYSASLLNISAMSFGALSKHAILALNGGAKKGNFAHNTGEGGISPHHLEPGGDLIWQIGTAYFGCRTSEGRLDSDLFAEQATNPVVKMIELKLSQGAKPGHGGVLPGCKVTEEIAEIRHVPVGQTVFSPPGHREFHTPREMLEFIARLRKLSGGKPVGFKLCIGHRGDFFAICKGILETKIMPDFITVDGGEGGTGAAPLEFSNSVGMPARDGLMFVHNALRGAGLRDKIKIISSGKILTGFHMIRAMAIGADACASARGMMLSLGCIQALRCNTDHCPTGIATQNRALYHGLDVTDKAERVACFHRGTMKGFCELLGAIGLSSPADLEPHHIYRRVDDLRALHLGELYDIMEPGQFLHDDSLPEYYKKEWQKARPDCWTC